MKVIIYRSTQAVPFDELFKPIGNFDKVFFSNTKPFDKSQVEVLLPDEKDDSIFVVPEAWKVEFNQLLKDKLGDITWQEDSSPQKPRKEEISSGWSEELAKFYDEQVEVIAILQLATTVTQKGPPGESKVYSCPESIIALMSFFYDGILGLLLALKTFIFQPVQGAIIFVVALVGLLPILLMGLQRHQVNHQVSLVKSQWEEGKFEDACKKIKQFDTVESRTISMACKEREKAMERKIEDEGQHDNAINITEKCYEVKGGEGFSIVTQNTGVSEESIRQKNDYVWDGKNKKCKKWESSSKIGEGWWLIIPSTNPSLKDCPNDVKKAKLKCQP